MRFADFISRDAVRPHLVARDKEGVIRELIAALADAGKLAKDDVGGVIKAILRREELGSTGIGHGVAVPHTKHSGVPQLTGAVGISPEGVEFDSLDGGLVHIVVMLISPPDRPGDHLKALENTSRKLRNAAFRQTLRNCKAAEEIMQHLDEADNNQLEN